MRENEAINWIYQVGGEVYKTRTGEEETTVWVVVVRMPPVSGSPEGRMIVALGGTMEEATSAAEGQWQAVWQGTCRVH